jgi:hypothetical protein
VSDSFFEWVMDGVLSHVIKIEKLTECLQSFKDKEVIIDGENKKEQRHLIPNTKMNLYNDKYTFFNISN